MNLNEALTYLKDKGYLLSEVYTSARVKDELRQALINFETKISKYAYKIYVADKRYSHTNNEWDANPYDHYCPVRVFKEYTYDIHNKQEFDKWINSYRFDPNIREHWICFAKTNRDYVGKSHWLKISISNTNEPSDEYVDEEGIELEWANADTYKYNYGSVEDFITWLENIFNTWKEADIKSELASRRSKEEWNKKYNEDRAKASKRNKNFKDRLAAVKRLLSIPLQDLNEQNLTHALDIVLNRLPKTFASTFERVRDGIFEERVCDECSDEDGNPPTSIDYDVDFGYSMMDLLTNKYDYTIEMVSGLLDVDEDDLREEVENADLTDNEILKIMLKHIINRYKKSNTVYDALIDFWTEVIDNDDEFSSAVDYEVRRQLDYDPRDDYDPY